jgi:hypothetical protein
MVLSLIQEFLGPKEKIIPLLPKNEIEIIKEMILKKDDAPLVMMPEERRIVEEIKSQTKQGNTNNITRTRFYLEFYKNNPEIEWSFLAHMVSRNGGYHMTDLKGDILPSLLDDVEAGNLFMFLEKANAFIFHDAFPQLLLYKKSVEKKTPLFHLLPAFGVSKAMTVFWERFWNDRNSKVMTLALIINEQSMLQSRLLSKIKEDYLYEKLLFLLQDRLEFTTVFFPYKKRKHYSLAGTSISHFEDTEKRIAIGKKLYSILFMKNAVYSSSFDFALKTPHTGSRSDYWPEHYSSIKTNTTKLFSPDVESAWSNIVHSFPNGDWVRDETLHYIDTLGTLSLPDRFDVTSKARLVVKLSSEIKSLST